MNIYFASKLHHAEKWIEIRDKLTVNSASPWYEHRITSSWINLVGNTPDSPEWAKAFWARNLSDIKERSTHVIVYAEKNDRLRGALIEAGIALAFNKFVIVVGEHVDYGTWQYHPKVLKAADLSEAAKMAHISQYS